MRIRGSAPPVRRRVLMVAMAVLSGIPSAARGQVNEWGNPAKLSPRPTSGAISEADLRTRLYVFADDSMMGRQTGREGNMKGTAYIARELARLGIEPAGEDGYFQPLPYVLRHYTPSSEFRVNGRALRWNVDFVAVPGRSAPRALRSAQVIFGGVAGDTTNLITSEQAAGRIVLLLPAEGGQRGFGGRGGGRGRGRGNEPDRFADAAAVVTADLDALSLPARAFLNDAAAQLDNPGAQRPDAAAPTLRVTSEAAALLLGRPLRGTRPGTAGVSVEARLDFVERPVPEYGRNVVGIIRGSDPALRGQFVAIGAHNDHVGYNAVPVDHDSLRAFNAAVQRVQMSGGDLRAITPEERAAIRVNVDSLRRIRPARLDSIRNGADDDGSGSMAVLEIAEAIASMPTKPRRSILFVWHTGEESGLSGSRWYTANPTVPRDSIVAQINIDMIGRGRSGDVPGGGDDYLGVVGSKRLSTDLGETVAAVNGRQQRPLELDYRFDETTSWPGYNNIYGRSDHANYANYNIPIAFFFTGLHSDYHQITDEPQYIDYPHYARITNYIRDVMVELGNRSERPKVDKATVG